MQGIDRPMKMWKPFAESTPPLRLILPVDPKDLSTAQQKGDCPYIRNGKARVRHFIKEPVARSRTLLIRALRAAAPIVTRAPARDTPWVFRVVYVYKPKGLTAKMKGKFKLTAPDGDNLTKDLLDCITKVGFAWADDAQAHCAGEYRRYAKDGEEACIILTLKQLPATSGVPPKPSKKGKKKA